MKKKYIFKRKKMVETNKLIAKIVTHNTINRMKKMEKL